MVPPDIPSEIKETRNGGDLAKIVNQIDSLLTARYGEPKALNSRRNLCGPAAFMFKRKAQKEGLDAEVWQNSDLHRTVGGTREDKSKAYQHVIAIVKLGGKFYLVDPAICQFIKPDGVISRDGAGIIDKEKEYRHIKNEPVLQKLYEKGFIHLTDANLRGFLGATTTNLTGEYIEKINKVTVEGLLANTPARRPDYTDEKLDEMLKPLNSSQGLN